MELLHESPQLLSTDFSLFASHNGRNYVLPIKKQQDMNEKSEEFAVKGSTLGGQGGLYTPYLIAFHEDKIIYRKLLYIPERSVKY